ncbi:squalene/phytoene synthase family protein [Acetobacter senegalensis]|uniref:squalene/phytoene synthase family protein n=1 Tax=Acetobacter senegalensis TaxID=446692 RepID=UPI000777865A|nr:squalene/phytoene synthase family protein [Acetobacter senegalensis]
MQAKNMGKDYTNENFPVASLLFNKKNRDVVVSYYKVARFSDDIADCSKLNTKEKINKLYEIKQRIMSDRQGESIYGDARSRLTERGVSIDRLTDLISAFHMDVVGRDYDCWDDLVEYCKYSANPVGRFILDLHGESDSLYCQSDALCSALQIINHIQDCRQDFHQLRRIYIPGEFFYGDSEKKGDMFLIGNANYLDMSVKKLADKNRSLLAASSRLPLLVKDIRLSMWINSVHTIATELNSRISRLGICERRHKLSGSGFVVLGLRGAMSAALSSGRRYRG